MKITEIISESTAPMHLHHKSAMQNVLTSPDLNMSIGSQYMNYRFGIALAGSPDEVMPADNYIAGDPMYTTYAEEEMEILQVAAKQMGIQFDRNWSGGKSKEPPTINTKSPVKSAGPVVLKNK